MRIPMYQVDAFADRPFAGNPAAVCVLRRWLPRETLQAIAAENNLSETAYLVREADGYAIRWFTPVTEMDLAGHPTLAAGFVVFRWLEPERTEVVFASPSGPLEVRREGTRLSLSLPSRPARPMDGMPGLADALGARPEAVLRSRDVLVVLPSATAVRELVPDFRALEVLDAPAFTVTAPGDDCDFVSRFFAPRLGVDEDPVTGSAHCTLVPYWAQRLGKSELHARQLSRRGGELWCSLRGERVSLEGQVAPFLEGFIMLDQEQSEEAPR